VKINLGSGDPLLHGWVNLDGARGDEIFPLPYPDASADEIRASHVLEHFSHRMIGAVLADWTRVLRPGGMLRVAVPDLELIAQAYLSGHPWPIQGYLMGGQVDDRDYHKAAFDREALTEALRAAGLVGIHGWKSEIDDCARLQASLNLCGWKRPERWPKVAAVMSVPRLGFMDNFFCAFQALVPLRIPLRKTTGAFWGQCLTRAIEMAMADESPEWILAVDYDSLYSRADVEDLLAYATFLEADAVAPIQASRTAESPLFFMRGADGKPRGQISREELDRPLVHVESAHFGCTLIRTDALAKIARPWFHGRPDPDGRWEEGRMDDDIHFWRQWQAAGLKVHIAPRVAIGHAELMVRWPGEDLRPIHQHPSDYHAGGKPAGIWR
jgi:SAM-dependent methyltransferase